MSGQMSLFDFFSEEEKKEYEMQYPDVGEYDDAQKLALEKDVLGIYVSGHPLENIWIPLRSRQLPDRQISNRMRKADVQS